MLLYGILIIKEVKIISVNVLINNQLDASFRLCGGRGRGGDVFVFVFIMFIMFIVYCVLFCILFLFVFFVFVFVRSEEAYFFKFTVVLVRDFNVHDLQTFYRTLFTFSFAYSPTAWAIVIIS